MSFINKVVIITGAGSGMGAAISEHFAKLNARLCLIDINLDNLMKVGEECEKISNNKVLTVLADLSKDGDVKRCIDNTIEEFGKLDVLINCAGIHGPGGLRDSDIMEKYDKVMSVNLRAVIAMTSKATPALIDNKGCVVNISSITSKLAATTTLPYNLSKIGVTHFTKCAALDLAKDGVRVNCISPGPVKTNLLTNAGVKESDQNPLWDAVREATPLKRMVNAEEVAELAAFLASDKSNSITGSDFVIDSGFLLFPSNPLKEVKLNK